jgi:hypothetical protein
MKLFISFLIATEFLVLPVFATSRDSLENIDCNGLVKCPDGTRCVVSNNDYKGPKKVCEPILSVECQENAVQCSDDTCQDGYYCREIYEAFACPKLVCIEKRGIIALIASES